MGLQLYDLAGAEAERRFSPYCWRIKLALMHKGLPFDTIPVAIHGQGCDRVLRARPRAGVGRRRPRRFRFLDNSELILRTLIQIGPHCFAARAAARLLDLSMPGRMAFWSAGFCD